MKPKIQFKPGTNQPGGSDAIWFGMVMLLTPYPAILGIRVSATFAALTLTAHFIFGATTGLPSIGLEKWLATC